jgi:hypothetical protein
MSSGLALFGSRWEQLPGYFLGEVWVTPSRIVMVDR